MDLDEFRVILSNSRVDLWELIDAAITVASVDYGPELKVRRDHIVERLYTTPCRNCDVGNRQSYAGLTEDRAPVEKGASPVTPQSIHREDDDVEEEEKPEDDEERDPYGGLFDDDEETKILKIKDQLEDPDQSEDSLVELLQSLADMDITFKALKETDIGRHVNCLRKHPSNEVRRLVKQLVRNWKYLVDEWVKVNTPDQRAASTLIDGDSPQPNKPRRDTQNGHHQVPDVAYSPIPHNGNNLELEQKPKQVPRREAPAKQPHVTNSSASGPPKRQQKDSNIDLERLASARKRLQENYQEAQNAKKQRTIQVMDIHEIPKPKNTFFARNKGGPHGRQR